MPSKTLSLWLLTVGISVGMSVGAPATAQNGPGRLVVVGDSLAAGFQSGGLVADGQLHSFGRLIADAAGVRLELPTIAEPGIPNTLQIIDPGPPPDISPKPGVSLGRINPNVQVRNLAVPGHTVQDALTLQPSSPVDSLTDLILGLPGLTFNQPRVTSQVEAAEALKADTILVWLGSNDLLDTVLFGDPSLATDVADFEAAFTELVRRLTSTGADVLVGNVPDVTTVAYLSDVTEAAALIGFGSPIPILLHPTAGVSAGDLITADGIFTLAAIMLGTIPGPLPANQILTQAEVRQIQSRVAAFNDIVATQAAAFGAILVDTHALVEKFDTVGVSVGGTTLGTGFLGGIYSLDGLHPTNTAQALVANTFIRMMNLRLGMSIPKVDVAAIASADPLVAAALGPRPWWWGFQPGDMAETARVFAP